MNNLDERLPCVLTLGNPDRVGWVGSVPATTSDDVSCAAHDAGCLCEPLPALGGMRATSVRTGRKAAHPTLTQ